ncbi:MAG: hypothetical protein PHS94_09620 [Erysipelotrichaceae bacterium]|nr:hypothetical protein [Erysipelotrichaceae bacterium]
MKQIQILWSYNDLADGVKGIEIFESEKYIDDFEKLINDHFPQYQIKYLLIEEEWNDDKVEYLRVIGAPNAAEEDKILNELSTNNVYLPLVIGDIDEAEANRIIDELYEDPFCTYHADGDYFSPID